MPAASASTKAQRLWDRVEALARQIAREEIAAALTNLRPGGAVSAPLILGSPGVPLVANLTAPWMFVRVDFPVIFDQIHVIADVTGTIEIFFRVTRSALGEALPNASPIFGGLPLLRLVAEQEHVFDLAGRGPLGTEPAPYVEPGSVLHVYIKFADGFISVLSINLRGRAV